MKIMVRRYLSKIIIVCMLLTLAVNFCFQVKLQQRDMDSASETLFWQIGQILSENKIETEEIKDEFARQCLVKANAAAYIVQNKPSLIENQKEMKRIAELLQIDELHIFNTEGVIYAGSEPKYYGYHFRSGEQMEFFLPMLEDKTLELCQPITPNTAEEKLMQYAAVWRKDGEGIIQIGMEPARVLEATKKNELSYIFSLLTEESGTDLYAADPQTYEILGATSKKLVGKTLMDIGISREKMESSKENFHAEVNGKFSYCKFSGQNDIFLVRISTTDHLYKDIVESTMLVTLYLLVISEIMIISISRYLDRNIILGIEAVNGKLQKIAKGDWNEKVEVDTTTEFVELSGHINYMVRSLLDTTDKLSSVLDMAQMPIGIYEYDHESGRVRITSKVPEILALAENEKESLLDDYKLFEEKLEAIKSCPVDEDKVIFQLPGNVIRYVKIESYVRENSVFGILMDVTKDFNEKKRIEQERDEDVLTGLYCRRAFYGQAEAVFNRPEELKDAVVIAIDTDNLKYVNDCYGHEAGDYYLRGMADILRSSTAPKKIVSRLGGDEFALLIYGCGDREELEGYIAQIKEQQGKFVIHPRGDLQLRVQFSMGSAFYQEDGEEFYGLMKCADGRMYEEKRQKHKRREMVQIEEV